MFQPRPSRWPLAYAPTERRGLPQAPGAPAKSTTETPSPWAAWRDMPGMFATAPRSCGRSARCAFERRLVYAHRRAAFLAATVALFTAPQALAANARTLGWMVPTQDLLERPLFLCAHLWTYGLHGTSIWIDPRERQLFVILLTNRVYPTRGRQRQNCRRAPGAARCGREALGPGVPFALRATRGALYAIRP